MYDSIRLLSDVSEDKLRRFAAVVILLALVGCAPAATGQGQAPAWPYPRNNDQDIRNGMSM